MIRNHMHRGNSINETVLYMHIHIYHMWESHVEIKGYSIAYFNCIAVFEVVLLNFR